jgi:phosphomannomutase
LGTELVDAYVDRIASRVPRDAPRQLRWVYTPLHGVGGALVDQVVGACRFPPAEVIAEQAEPDPKFPTVAFPNPEEPGAIDLALARAEEVDADLVIANDPDADRLAAAVVVDGHWRMLRGDELGVLLADDVLRRGVRGTYACSIVSSSQLAAMSAAYDQPFVYTLTGFKWIGRVPGLVYGYEEAIGYCVDPEAVPDKDGISALARLLTLAAGLKAAGWSIADRLDEIARRYGVYETDQMSLRVEHAEIIGAAMARLRTNPPKSLAGQPTSVVDLAYGSDELPPTDAVLIDGETIKVVVRPSGTEPKLKCYLEARLPVPGSADLAAKRAKARSMLATIRSEMSAILGIAAADRS